MSTLSQLQEETSNHMYNNSLTDEDKIKLEILLKHVDDTNDDCLVENEGNINESRDIYENPFKYDNTINNATLRKLKELEEQLNEFRSDGPLDRQVLIDELKESIEQDERVGNYNKIEQRLKNVEEKLDELQAEKETSAEEVLKLPTV